MLEIQGIKKSFGNLHALDGVSLSIRDGEFFSLLGPSGCGKTTLLRIIAGFERPDQGQLSFNGHDIDWMAPNHRPFNMVFQKYALFPHLNVEKNIMFGLKMLKVDHLEAIRRVSEALDLVQMTDFARRDVTTLSGGQQQRVALARALVNRPRVLLLDEPLSALDMKLREQMQLELLKLQRKLKITFIFVTHDQDEAMSLSDRIAVFNQGKIEQVGSPSEVYHSPNSFFVADFIGSMNHVRGKVISASDSLLEVTWGLSANRIRVEPSQASRNFSPGEEVWVGIRPEHMNLFSEQKIKTDIPVRVREIIFRGPEAHVLVQTDSKGLDTTPITVSIPTSEKITLSRGDLAYLCWPEDDSRIVGIQ